MINIVVRTGSARGRSVKARTLEAGARSLARKLGYSGASRAKIVQTQSVAPGVRMGSLAITAYNKRTRSYNNATTIKESVLIYTV